MSKSNPHNRLVNPRSAAASDQLPPHDTEAEAGALACILTADTAEAPAMLEQLTPEDFYDHRHRQVFSALRCLSIDCKPLTCVSLAQWLKDRGKLEEAGGLDYIAALPDRTPSAGNFPTYLEVVRDRASRRATLGDATELASLARDTAVAPSALRDAARRMAEAYSGGGEGEQADPWCFSVDDAALIVIKELPPVTEVVEGIVTERSKLGIGSSAKSCKTFLGMDLGLSIAHGVLFLERKTTRCRVLYVNLELKQETFERRLQAIAEAKNLEVEAGWFLHLPLRGKLAGARLSDIVSHLFRIAIRLQVGVVIIDPTYKLNTEGIENDSRDQARFYNEIDRLTTDAGCTVILIDHSGKGNQSEKEPLDVFRGSSVKGGDLDAAMILRKHEVDGCLRVDLVHRELPPVAPFVIGWNFPLMQLRPDLDADAMKKPRAGRTREHDPRKLVAAIAGTTAGNPISISKWAEAAGVTRQTLQGYLPGLRAKGWIATAGEGNSARQYLTEKGQQAAREYLGETT